MELIVEVIGTTNNVLERHRFRGDRVRIGRGYSNDIILSDEHADVHHAELEIDDEERIWINDLNSVNGTSRRKGRKRIDREQVDSGDVFLLGRNRLRVFAADHEMPAAVPLRPVESFLLWLGRSPVIALLLAIYIVMTFLSAHNRTFGEFDWSAFARGQMMGVVTFLALVAGVYLLSVLFKRSGNFLSHLSVLLFVAVLSALTSFLLDIARFNGGSNSYGIIETFDSASGYGFTFLYLWSVFYLAFNLSLRARTLISGVIVGIGITFATLTAGSIASNFYQPRFPEVGTFMPDALLFARPLPPQEFAAQTIDIFDAIEELKAERLNEREAAMGGASQ